MEHLDRKAVEQCLAIVKAQFAAHIDAGAGNEDGPKIYEPGFHSSSWTIAWDGGPEEWAVRAFRAPYSSGTYLRLRQAGKTIEEALREATGTNPHAVPAGVYAEPVNSWCLGLYVAS